MKTLATDKFSSANGITLTTVFYEDSDGTRRALATESASNGGKRHVFDLPVSALKRCAEVWGEMIDSLDAKEKE